MTTLRQVRTTITTPDSHTCYSNLYFDATTPNGPATNTAVRAFWTAVSNTMQTSCGIVVDGDTNLIDSTTGDIVGFDGGAPGLPIFGKDGQEPLPGQVQGLIRWNTMAVYLGKRIQGRMFIPGMTELGNVSGAPRPDYVTIWSNAAQGLILAGLAHEPLVIWSRPQPAKAGPPPVPVRPGGIGQVTSGAGENDWATLRRRFPRN